MSLPAQLIVSVLGLLAREGHPRPAQAVLTAQARSRPVLRELERAAAGLLYLSEGDFPLEVVHFPSGRGPPSAGAVARALGRPPAAPFAEQTLEQFFATAVTPRPWHSPVEQESVRRFRVLVQILRSQLRDTRVFRFGALDIDVYVVGVTSAGDWAGLATHLVQT
jgi:hypothetical protein